MNRNELLSAFSIFSFGTATGLGSWLSEKIHPVVCSRLLELPGNALTKVQFNQLLVLSQVGSVSDGYFKYYWRTLGPHTYDTRKIEGFDSRWVEGTEQVVLDVMHLRWGLYRVFIDGLLYFGNVRAAFEALRSMSFAQIGKFFADKRFDSAAIAGRGPAFPLFEISRDDRHLISEMVCKNFGELPGGIDSAREVLGDAWDQHSKQGGGTIQVGDFLKKYLVNGQNQDQLMLSYDEIVSDTIDSKASAEAKFDQVAQKFSAARKKAIENTELYLSMVNDLDIYVATSMRSRKNFRDMADACRTIFGDARLQHLHLRHFDPTLSAAAGHEDKGLIECLMVKCAKVLVYCEGEKESYGKDAEAAMALSLGKPVIFFCDHGKKTNFYRDVHPLARLIDFRSGVAVGAIVSDDPAEVSELVRRIFDNDMEYRLEHHTSRPGFLKVVEVLTDSVVRLQTDDELITKTFWNNYHNRSARAVPSLASGKEAERLQE